MDHDVTTTTVRANPEHDVIKLDTSSGVNAWLRTVHLFSVRVLSLSYDLFIYNLRVHHGRVIHSSSRKK